MGDHPQADALPPFAPSRSRSCRSRGRPASARTGAGSARHSGTSSRRPAPPRRDRAGCAATPSAAPAHGSRPRRSSSRGRSSPRPLAPPPPPHRSHRLPVPTLVTIWQLPSIPRSSAPTGWVVTITAAASGITASASAVPRCGTATMFAPSPANTSASIDGSSPIVLATKIVGPAPISTPPRTAISHQLRHLDLETWNLDLITPSPPPP